MDINGLIRIRDLLKEHPELEDVIVEMNPVYRKLKNPLLRKQVGGSIHPLIESIGRKKVDFLCASRSDAESLPASGSQS